MAVGGDCTDTCPVPSGFLSYRPTLAASIAFLSVFSLLCPINIYTAVRYRSPLFTSILVAGLLAEALGYAGRIFLHADVASSPFFAIFMAGTILGPTFISAAIYSLLPRLPSLYGDRYGPVVRPFCLQVFSLAFDIFTLVFQAVGVAFSVNGRSKVEMAQGINILLAGLAMQATSLVMFLVLYWSFRYRISHRRDILSSGHSHIFLSKTFKTCFICLQIAAGLLLLRATARIAQFSGGLAGKLAQSEIFPLVLDGVMVFSASVLVTVVPPAAAFGSAWGLTSPLSGHSSPGTSRNGQVRMATSNLAISLPYTQSGPQLPYFPPPPTTPSRRQGPPTLAPPRFPPTRPLAVRPPYEPAQRTPIPFVPDMSNSSSRRARDDGMVAKDNLW